MTLLSETTSRWSGARSRYLRALPLTALAIDIAIMVGIGLVAIVGRRELDIFTSSARVESSVSVAGPLIIAGWIATIALTGGYKKDVFGAGTDEYRRVFNASIIAAGLSGVGCYQVRPVPRLLSARLRRRDPSAARRTVAAAASSPTGAQARLATPASADRR